MYRQRLSAEDWAIRIGIALFATILILLVAECVRADAPTPRGPVLFVYMNEGSNTLGGGGGTAQRDALVAMLDPVIRYGFKTIALRSYPGCVRNDYYAPLIAKCKPAGVAVVGSGYDLSVFTAFYGSSDSPEWWPLSDRTGDKSQPRAPPAATQPSRKLNDRDHYAVWQVGLLDGRVIDSMRDAAIKVAAITGTPAAVFDLEYVLYATKQSAFWTDANISAVATNFARLVVSLKEAGIRPMLYHPTPGMDAAYDRIALNILARLVVQEVADWPVHLSPHNYYVPAKIASWGKPPTLPQVDALYGLGAGPLPTVFYGLASNRQLSQGWSASEFDTLIRTAGIADRCWLFIGAPKSAVASDFAVLPPLK